LLSTSPLLILLTPRPPRSKLFPYTTLFRSKDGRPPMTYILRVGSHFLTAMEIPVLLGRDLDTRDLQTALRVGVINERFANPACRSEEHTSELQSPDHLVCRLLLEKKKT